MRPVRMLPTALRRGQLPYVSCWPARYWPALKEQAAAGAWGATPSSITSPDPMSANQDAAGRPRACATQARPPAACLGVVRMR